MSLSEHGFPSRRRFLALTASGAVGAFASLGRADASKSGDDDFAGLKVGVQSSTFSKFDLEQVLKQTRELGLKYVEFSKTHVPLDSSPDRLKGTLKLCREYGLTPIAFGVAKFTKNHDGNKKLFDLAAGLEIRYLSADPDPDSFDSLDKLCESTKIAIAIHPHGPSGKAKDALHRWYSAEKILAAVKDHHPLIGSCLDTGHLIRSAQLGKKLDPVQQIELMGNRNFGIHLKDHDNKRKEDVVFGSPAGQLDVAGVLRTLRAVKFTGYMSIEYEANKDNPKPDVQKCVAYLKEAVKKVG